MGRWVLIALGCVLLVAAGLKWQAWATETAPPTTLMGDATVRGVIVATEIAVGLWLLSGIAAPWAWATALAMFSLFAAISFRQGWLGEPSCGCLGRVQANPWWIFGFDVGVIVSLCLLRQSFHNPLRKWEISKDWFKVVGSGVILSSAIALTYAEKLGLSPSRCKLYAEEKSQELGGIWETEKLAVTLPVWNFCYSDMEVVQFLTSCSCVNIEPRSFSIAPKQKLDLKLNVNLTKTQTREGKFAIQIVPKMSQSTGPIWSIRGEIKKAVQVPRRLFLGRHSEAKSKFNHTTVDVAVHEQITDLRTSFDPSQVDLELNPKSRSKYELKVRPKSFARGEFKSIVRFIPYIGLEELPETSIVIEAEIVRDLQPNPQLIQRGGVPIGGWFEETIDFGSLTGTPVDDLSAGPSMSSETLITKLKSNLFLVRQHVSTTGFQTHLIHFRSSRSEIPLRIEFTGLEH